LYEENGLKVDDYCAQHGLSRNAYFYRLRKIKEAAITQSGFVEVRQQVEGSSCYPSPKLTASVNEIVLGIDEKTSMDLLLWGVFYSPFFAFIINYSISWAERLI